MIKIAKNSFAAILLQAGLVGAYRVFSDMMLGSPVPILCVHKVVKDTGRLTDLEQIFLMMGHLGVSELLAKLKFLKKEFKVISLDEYIELHKRRDRLPKKSCVLTFDDGDLEHYIHAYPVLEKLRLPATFFIPATYISNNECKWDDRIAGLIAKARLKRFSIDMSSVAKRHFTCGTIGEKAKTVTCLCRVLKYADERLRCVFIRKLSDALQLCEDEISPDFPKVMSWNQIRTMAKDPLVSIGAHTETHPVLVMLSDEEVRNELDGSRKEIEEKIGMPVTLFCYPFGKSADFNERVKVMVKEAGFRAACSFCYGRNDRQTDMFALKRIPLLPEPLPIFKVRMSGIFDFISERNEKTRFVNDYIAANIH